MAEPKTQNCSRVFFLYGFLFLLTLLKFQTPLTLSSHNYGSKNYSNKNHVIFRKPAGKCGNCGERGEGVITLFDAGAEMAYVPIISAKSNFRSSPFNVETQGVIIERWSV